MNIVFSLIFTLFSLSSFGSEGKTLEEAMRRYSQEGHKGKSSLGGKKKTFFRPKRFREKLADTAFKAEMEAGNVKESLKEASNMLDARIRGKRGFFNEARKSYRTVEGEDPRQFYQCTDKYTSKTVFYVEYERDSYAEKEDGRRPFHRYEFNKIGRLTKSKVEFWDLKNPSQTYGNSCKLLTSDELKENLLQKRVNESDPLRASLEKLGAKASHLGSRISNSSMGKKMGNSFRAVFRKSTPATGPSKATAAH